MSWRIRLAATTKRQIADVLAKTLDEFGERKHAEYLELIGLALEEIAADPAGPRSATRAELHPDARTFHIARAGKRARHIFVYRIRPGGWIDVGRFLYDGMDLARHLPRGFGRDA